jgi:Tfp pilus assembly protein PilF
MQQAQMQQPQMQQPQTQQPQMPIGGWSKTDLDAIGRVEMPVEEPKSGLGVSGKFKGGAAAVDGLPEELRVSQRVHRPDPELSASGKFIAAEIVAAGGFQPGTGPHFDPRSLMEAPPAKKPLDMVVIGSMVVAFLIVGYVGFDAASYLMSSGPSEVNAAANEIRMGNDDAADAKLRRVLKANSAHSVAKMTLAVSLIDRKKYDEAIALCNEVLKSDADAADAFRIRAVANSQLQKYGDAIKDVDAYLKAAPEDDPSARSQALAVRAFSDMKLGKLDDSIADYTKAIKLDERNLHLFASRGTVRDMKKKRTK